MFGPEQQAHIGLFLRHRPDLHTLAEGGILGAKAKREGWHNVGEHCAISGVMSDNLAELLQLEPSLRAEIVTAAFLHDKDKRRDKERAKLAQQTSNGLTHIQVDSTAYTAAEMKRDDNSLVRVTGMDWRDFDEWGIGEKVIRYVDSSIGPDESGRDTILDWRTRVANLAVRYPDLHQSGLEIYGAPTFDVLREITGQIESELHAIVINNNPSLAIDYPTPENLNDLLRTKMYGPLSFNQHNN
jgi:hypothetical protein